jgi:hypothetical protein
MLALSLSRELKVMQNNSGKAVIRLSLVINGLLAVVALVRSFRGSLAAFTGSKT